MGKIVKANKGEWSEFYALLKLLADQKLYAADENLQRIENIFYPVLKVITQKGTNKQIGYDLTVSNVNIQIKSAVEKSISSIQRSEINNKLTEIFNLIKNSKGTTFEIEDANKLIDKLHCYKVQASSSGKADIYLVIHDRITGTQPEVGFSIKSQLGSPSTLLNASGATNFTFEVQRSKPFSSTTDNYLKIPKSKMFRDKMNLIDASGSKMVYVGVENSTFESNLQKIDSFLPELLSEILKVYYEGKASKLTDIVKIIEQTNPLQSPHFKPNIGFYEYKIKNFLMSVALGMMPGTPWDGLIEAQGGYIIVKQDGEIVCYHIYNHDQFRQYLFSNTKLDTPSTSRHGFGEVYIKNKKFYMKLNLQIRFTA
jgi:hypothetical protein